MNKFDKILNKEFDAEFTEMEKYQFGWHTNIEDENFVIWRFIDNENTLNNWSINKNTLKIEKSKIHKKVG